MDITARVAQLWCLPKHENKVMDPDFAESIIALVTEAHAAGKAAGLAEGEAKRRNDVERDSIIMYRGAIKTLEAKLAAMTRDRDAAWKDCGIWQEQNADLTAEAGRLREALNKAQYWMFYADHWDDHDTDLYPQFEADLKLVLKTLSPATPEKPAPDDEGRKEEMA